MSTNINIKKKLAILDEGASVTTDASSIDFVGSGVNSSTIDGDVTITIPGGSGNTTYYLNQSVTQTPYKEFSSVATTAAEQVVPLIVLAGATSVIAEFQTISGVPGTTQIPGGLWQFFLHFNAGAAGQNWIIRPTIYKRDLAGIETLLFTPDPEIVTGMSTTTTMYVCDGVFPASTILTTDRIVVRISIQNTTGVSQTVNFRTEGSQHYSVALTTLNQVIPTGAVTSVIGTAPIVSSGGLTPAISIPQSSATVDGYLSSSNWSVFDAKVGGSGTINYLSKFTGTGTLGNSQVQDNGTGVGIGTSPLAGYKLYVSGAAYANSSNITIPSITGENTGDITGTYIGVYGVGIYSDSPYADAIYIGGKFIGTNGQSNANANSYSVQLQDGSEGVGKVLTSMTADGKAQWTALSTSIPQAQVLYVDSANGINATTGRGDINTPYLTPEYALSNTTNTGTITTNTATNTTLSAISDASNALLEVGMYISGSGIPFGTIIVAKGNQGGNANTVTLSKATTATATGVTLTWWKTYEVQLSGTFNAASNWYKQGFYINVQTSKVYWGNLTLYNITESPSIPYYSYSKGSYIGTHINSILCSTNVSLTRTTDSIYYFEIGTTQSVTTSRVIDFRLNANKPHPFDYVTFTGTKIDALFGYVFGYDSSGSGTAPTQTTINFNSYGLLGGIVIYSSIIYGYHKCPSSISVLITSNSNVSGTFTGSMNLTSSLLNGAISGTTLSSTSSSIKLYPNGSPSTINLVNSSIDFSGYMSVSALNFTSGLSTVYGYFYPIALTISSGATMVNYSTITDDWSGNSFTNSGTFINNGTFTGAYLRSITNNGTIENYGKLVALGIGNGTSSILRNYSYLQLNSYGLTCSSATTVLNRGIITTANVGNTGYLILLNNASAVFKNYGVIENTSVTTTQSLINKTLGKLQLFAGSELRVSNSKSPIKCTANTSASKDIYVFNAVTNCDGTTYGLSIAFDGTSFAPNDLVGGTVYENINY